MDWCVFAVVVVSGEGELVAVEVFIDSLSVCMWPVI